MRLPDCIYIFSPLKEVHAFDIPMQITVPARAMPTQRTTVLLQPKDSVNNAIPYVEIAAPTQVDEFIRPDTNETLPYLAK